MKDYGYSPSGENPDMQHSRDLEFTEESETTDDLENVEESEFMDVSEEEIAEYKRNRAKLSRTMLIGCIVIILAFIGLVLLNKYFSG
jgi:uncharacterized membrane protein YcjF (UPF0283 family)